MSVQDNNCKKPFLVRIQSNFCVMESSKLHCIFVLWLKFNCCSVHFYDVSFSFKGIGCFFFMISYSYKVKLYLQPDISLMQNSITINVQILATTTLYFQAENLCDKACAIQYQRACNFTIQALSSVPFGLGTVSHTYQPPLI